MPAREQRLLLAAALATSALLLLAAFAGHPVLLAYAAPLFVVAIPLIAGRYVGEDRLERLMVVARRGRPRRIAAALPGGRRPAALVPRGGRLLARSLAERGPPAVALT